MPNVITSKPKVFNQQVSPPPPQCVWGGGILVGLEFGVIGLDFDPRNYLKINIIKLGVHFVQNLSLEEKYGLVYIYVHIFI